MSKKLRWFNNEYEKILHSKWTEELKSKEYGNLMSKMEDEFKIPMGKNEEWEKENRAIIALYRKISMSRNF